MIQEQIFTINRTTVKHEYIFSSIIHCACHGGTRTNTCVFCTQCSVLIRNVKRFSSWRSLGPKEAGSSSSTVIFRYEPSDFDRYTSQSCPNCEGNDKKRKYSNPLAKLPFSSFESNLACGPDKKKFIRNYHV